MAYPSPTQLAAVASAIVALIAFAMAYLSWKSYRRTNNPRLVFPLLAFLVFGVKSIFVVANELADPHPVPHDSVLFVAGLFDVLVVAMLFIPFISAPGR